MLWRVVRLNNSIRWAILAGLLGVIPSWGLAPTASAQDSEIGAKVCGSGSPGASIQITQPINDSVVNQTPTTFRGSVNNTSQIIIEIDGNYVSTLAIGSNQTTFNTDVSVNEGTHTIKMTANDICGGTDATDSIVITYQPATQPSTGTTTPTVVQGEKTLDGTPVDAQPIQPGDTAQPFKNVPVLGGAIGLIQDIARNIGLESTVTNSDDDLTLAGIARVAVTVAALTSVVMAGTIAPIVAHAYPGLSKVFHLRGHRYLMYLSWGIRGVGVLSMAVAYFI